MVTIKSWETKEVIYASQSDTIYMAVMECKRDGISLRKANLIDTELSGLDLSGMDFNEANFFRAKLAGVDFSGANLNLVNFTESDLSNSSFENAIMDWANFENANIAHTHWEKTRLTVSVRHIPRNILSNHCCQISIGLDQYTAWISRDYKVYVSLGSKLCQILPIPFYEAYVDQKRMGNHFGLLGLRMIDLWFSAVRYDPEFQDYESLAPLN